MTGIKEFFQSLIADGVIPQEPADYDAATLKMYIAHLEAENAELRTRLEKAVELPCKLGDTIYQTGTNGTRIFKSTVKNIIFETDGVAFDKRAIGESIFLTEETVKEKMKKLQEKNNG